MEDKTDVANEIAVRTGTIGNNMFECLLFPLSIICVFCSSHKILYRRGAVGNQRQRTLANSQPPGHWPSVPPSLPCDGHRDSGKA